MSLKILVPLDGSDGAYRALDFACHLATSYAGMLLLVHVGRDETLPAGLQGWVQSRNDAGLAEWALERRLSEYVLRRGEERARHHGVPARRRPCPPGDPYRVVADIASCEGVEFIVMPRRASGERQTPLGARAACRVGHLVSQTVITVT